MKDISLYEKVPPLKNNFQIKFFSQISPIGLLPHWHEHIELLYFVKGSCEFFCDGKSSMVKEGDLVVVNSTEIHTFTAIRATEYYCILIYPDFFKDINFSGTLIKNHIPDDSFVKNCIYDIRNEKENESVGSDLMIKSHACRLFSYLMRNYTETTIDPQTVHIQTEKLKRLDIVFNYISRNYNDKITTSKLAGLCYLSEGYFCRFFKNATGRTVADYITEYRIDKASVMLRSTDCSISEIASNTGFDDANYFSRVFKKTTGLSPTEYKKKYYSKDS